MGGEHRRALAGSWAVASLTFRSSLPRTLLAALLGTVLALLGAWLSPPEPDAAYHPASLWLHLAVTLTLVGGVANALDAWPGFGQDQPGRGAILRLRSGPLDGLPAAVGGGLLALALALAAAGLAFEWADPRSDARPLRETVEPLPVGSRAILHPGQPELSFDLPPVEDADRPWTRLTLRPRAVVPARDSALHPARVTVRLGASQIGRAAVFQTTGDVGEIELPKPSSKASRRLTLVRGPGPGVALAFEGGALQLSRAAPFRPPWQARVSAARAALAALLAGLVGFGGALLLAATGGPGASRTACLATGCGLAALAGPLGLSPHAAAIEALAADRWISTAHLAEGATGSLSIGLLAMLAAGLLRLVRPG